MNLRISSFDEYKTAYEKSTHEPEAFWEEIADTFTWQTKWKNTLSWEFNTPNVKWFEGGKLNITENLLDRHLPERADQVAFHWEPNNPNEAGKQITYGELYEEVCKLSNGLKELGVGKGDRVCIYMPMVIESVVVILACARIGAIHSIVFAGFSSQALADRINDAEAKLVLTADGLNRGGKKVDLKTMVDEAISKCPSVQHVVVLDCINSNPTLNEKDIWYHELISNQSELCNQERCK